MPTYVYLCDHHGEFEIFQSIRDEALSICPHCTEDGLTYYYCDTCKLGWFDKLLPENDKSIFCSKCLDKNPAQKSTKLKKLVALSSFILKGSGWAKDNYK